ncbi:MAG: thiamine biosynthesis lipoprotein [Janthinobacterium sp.]|jgi:thiamine biosynthesis lipoprotein
MKRRTFISGALGLGTLGLGLAVAPDRNDAGMQLYSGADLAFGTTMSIQVVHTDRHQAELAIADALAAAKKIDRLMTLHRPDSQVAKLNRTGVIDRPDPHLLAVLASASKLSAQTDGAFDVTVQPLWHAYRAAAARSALPGDEQRRAAMALVDYRQLAFDERRVALLQPGMAITLNGIAQGYAVDVARAALMAHGIRHALLDTGEFSACGMKDAQQDWSVGIRDPRDPHALAAVLALQRRCVATSGDYETVFTPDFAHHHIFDPASGDSPGELASVTVLAPSGLQADGLSTALMVLGAEKGLALAAALADVDVMLIGKDGRRWRSKGLPTLSA